MAEAPQPQRDLDWEPERARRFAGGIADLWADLLGSLPDAPVSPPLSLDAVKAAAARDVPEQPLAESELLEYLRGLLDQSVLCGSPRFLAYISGSGTVPGASADLLAAGLNANVGGWLLGPAATEVELALTRWLASRFGLPETAGGLILPGGAMANFVALKLARDARAGADVRAEGVSGEHAIYASQEAHVTIERAADMLGLGARAVRAVEVDELLRMRVGALEERLRADLADGVVPLAVVATAGTTGTGSIDPLPELAALAERHGLWFHVDAAYGGPAVLADDLQPLLAGIERADSVTVDPHKWLYTPLGSGCVLVRDLQRLADAFVVEASYVYEDQERTGRGLNLGELGPQFSRGFDALKVWVSLLAHGREAYARRISHDAALARYLGARVEERPDFVLAAPVSLSICCFRYRPVGVVDEQYLDALNERLMTELQLDGRVFVSNAVIHGRFALRACIVNFRTEASDLDAVLDVAAELGERLHAEMRPRL